LSDTGFVVTMYALALDHGVEENEGCEETGMEKREIDQLIASKAMPNSNNGPRHLVTEVIDYVKKIP
jgi:hypothetical protein